MKVLCLSFTDYGEDIGERLKKSKDYQIDHITNKSIKGGIKSIFSELWTAYDCLVFISASGIATRFIAPYVKDKTQDPAVVVIDDLGRFSISLLSGHLGGANKLAEDLAGLIGALPVITTASDARGFQSLDLFAKENNYFIEDMKSVTKLSSLMVNNKRIGFYTEKDKRIDYPNLIYLEYLGQINSLSLDGIIIISEYKMENEIKEIRSSKLPYLILRPNSINIGIGCRKGVAGPRIIEAIEEAFNKNDLSTNSIKSIGSVEVKKDEEGLIEAANYFKKDLKIFTLDEIKKVEDKFEKSQFVKDTIGVFSVSEPCAYLLGGEFVDRKGKYKGITISITKEDIND